MSFESETMKEVTPQMGYGGVYSDISLLRQSPRGHLYSALKEGKRFILKTAADGSGKALAMLKREYEMSLTLSHPGIAYVFTYEADSPLGPCIVMEYVDGVTLDSWLSEKPSLRQRRKAFSQLLDVVEYIHSRGVVHNDLAPQNIMISRADGSVKIIDFGFADDSTHYLATNLGCTRGYASPELLDGRGVDARSDIWSLGILMRDIFGKSRYRRISSVCTRRDPHRRYRSVSALKSAFRLTRVLPPVIIALVLVSCLVAALFSQRSMIVTLQERERERQEVEAYKDSVMTSLKSRVNAWYEDNAVPASEKLSSEKDYFKRIEVINSLVTSYNAFWKVLLSECPEECRTEFTTWITFKYNEDFPTP